LYSYDDYYNEMKSRFQHSHKLARDNIIRSKEKSKINYDKNCNKLSLAIGDKVMLRNENIQLGKSKKLQPLYKGPYEVIKINSDVNCTLLINRKPTVVHFNRLKKVDMH